METKQTGAARRAGVWVGVLLLGGFLAAACDEGLEPPPVGPAVFPGRISGTVRFVNWDSAGAVVDLRLVAFRNFPPRDIVGEVLQGNAAIYPPLGGSQLATPGTDSVTYTFSLTPGTYQYVAVAQQFGPDVMSNWRAVGQYDLDSNLAVPSAVTVTERETVTGIDITVDFDNLPPPPAR